MANKQKIVILGGGTGTFTVLKGLKKYADKTELSAIVTMTDSGGSTGRLRDEFGMLPVGDMRQCLIALAEEDEAGQLLRELFLYRFSNENSNLNGHHFGNLFLTALTDILGSEVKAIEEAGKLFNITGQILPVTTNKVELVAEYEDGSVLVGEKNIDEPDPEKHDCTKRVQRLWTQPVADIHPETEEAIREADLIVMGPGDLYSSLLSNIVVDDVAGKIRNSKAKFVYITNLVSKYGQSHGMTHKDYVAEIEKYVGKKPDYVIVNNAPLPKQILNKYKEEFSHEIIDDLTGKNIVRADLIFNEEIVRKSGDKIKRSLLRHDSDKLAKQIISLIK
jgi:uncharacterized cofD-like protein